LPTMFDHLSAGDAWVFVARDIVIKATLLLIVSAIVGLTLGRLSAALRHRVWAMTFVALLLLPVFCVVVPGITLPVIPDGWQRNWPIVSIALPSPAPADESRTMPMLGSTPTPPTVEPVVTSSSALAHANSASTIATRQIASNDDRLAQAVQPLGLSQAQQSANAERPSAAPSASHLAWLPMIWLSGVIVVLTPLLSGIIGNQRLRKRSAQMDDLDWRALVTELSHRLALRREVTLLVAGEGQMPMTFGVMRPYVLLPTEALEWSDGRRRIVLLHELAHIKRYDVPWQIVARVSCALYWFHPIAWWIVRRMRIDREHACDDSVLVAGQKASSYASHLLDIARGHRQCSPLATAALSMARRSQLEGRLLAVLDDKRTRTPLDRSRALALGMLAVMGVMALGVVRPAMRGGTTVLAADNKLTESATVQPSTNDNVVVSGRILSPQGEPVDGANIEVVAMERNDGWPIYRTIKQTIVYRPTTSGSDGRFEVSVPKRTTGVHPALWLIASAPGLAPCQEWLKPRENRQDVEITLSPAKELRVQLVDAIGNPVVGVQPHLWTASRTTRNSRGASNSFWLPDPEARAIAKLWPRWTRSDEQGYTTATLSSDLRAVQLWIDDDRMGGQVLGSFDVTDEPLAVVVHPPLFVSGKVLAADTGEPIAGAKVLLTERPYRFLETAADGSFRIRTAVRHDDGFRPDSEINLNVYPPPDSPYMFLHLERKRPTEGKNVEMRVKPRRGILVEGQVLERGTRQPVAGAQVFFRQQEYGNKLFNGGSWPNYSEAQMRYATDADGHFRIPVWPGPGYLQVYGPTNDYLHVMVSDGDLYYGKPGLQRNYPDGAVQVNYKPGEDAAAPVTFELERGVTLRRKVVLPDGQPAGGVLHARSYLVDRRDINGHTAAIPIENGAIELPGFGPEQSNPLFLLDVDHHCGLAISPTAAEADIDAPIQLLPCGSAKFHFIDEAGQPIADHEPRLHVVVTPGAPATHHITNDQPLWSDTIIWQNMYWDTVSRRKLPKTDADGYVVVNDLIPGATYNIGFVNKEGSWDEGYEFTVRADETKDVGDVRIPVRK
jgi:beta-lactamase regulating signal transducer with metallopeptidase domain